MKQGCTNLSYHRHPGCLQAIEESFREVKHAKEVDGEQVADDVGVSMLNDFFLLTECSQYRLREKQNEHEWQEDNSVDHACSV